MDRIADALRRTHSQALANTEIDVYNYTESYDPSTGTYSYTESKDADSPIPARVDTPNSNPEKFPYGTDAEVDCVIMVRDDSPITWVGYGEESEHATEVVDTSDSRRYRIEDVVDTHNGLLELPAVEV